MLGTVLGPVQVLRAAAIVTVEAVVVESRSTSIGMLIDMLRIMLRSQCLLRV